MPRPSVSVALCTYNGARFVVEQLESILAQTYPVTEIIVSDDGSTDDTLALIERLANAQSGAGPDIRVLPANDSPLGPARNFERAIGECSSDLIALSDQDDAWYPHRVEACVERLDTDPSIQLIVSDAELVDSRLRPKGTTVLGTLAPEFRGGGAPPVDELLRANAFPGMTFLFRRTLAERALPIPEHWLHDYWILLVALAERGLSVVDEPLVRYRQHDANVVGVAEVRGVELGRGLLNRLRGTDRSAQRGADLDRIRWCAATKAVASLNFADATIANRYLGKLHFESGRPHATTAFPQRATRVLAALATGKYSRYSRWGWKGFVRDL